VLCPEFTDDINLALQWVDEGILVLGRKNNHTQGRDIVSPKLKNRWNNSEYWVKFVPSKEEWRIHVLNGKVIARGKKFQYEDPWRKLLVRSRGNGWRLHEII